MARKFVTGDAPKAYTGGKTQKVKRSKVVKYKCGCTVTLGGFLGEKEAPFTCDKHHEPLAEVVTTEKFD